MARVEIALTGDLAILQGETYQALSLEFPGDVTTWTPRGQIRTKLLEESGTLLAEFSFETSTYDAATDITTIHPRLTPEQTASLPKTKWQGIGEYSKTAVYYYDIELVSSTGEVVKSKTAIVQVIGEVTGTGIPPTNTTETFLADPGSGTTGQLLARASDNKGDVTWVNSGHGGLLDADTLDGQEGTYYQDRANHTGTQAISTVAGLQTALDGKEPADSTILKSASIGVTVQGYNANTVIDANYVATENSYTTTEKNKLAGIEAGATADQTGAEIKTLYEAEADTNAYTDAEKTKLAGIASGAEVNVNADWNAVSGDAQILNKPTLGTAAATDSTDYATAAQGALADTALQPDQAENISGNYTFNGAIILPNNSRINGVEHFYQTTKPTVRGDSSALVAGDRWYKTDDGSEWFWNGTYWLSPPIESSFTSSYIATTTTVLTPGVAHPKSRLSSNGQIDSPLFIHWRGLIYSAASAWDANNYWSISFREFTISQVQPSIGNPQQVPIVADTNSYYLTGYTNSISVSNNIQCFSFGIYVGSGSPSRIYLNHLVLYSCVYP